MEFRAWIKNYIESSDITFPASSIFGGGAAASGRTQLPPGILIIYAGSSFGPDTLPCNGAAVSRTTYDKLFAAIGTTWGTGDGSSTFNVPDLRDRAIYGVGSIVGLGGTDGVALGSRGGPNHHHLVNGSTDSESGHQHDKPNGGAYALTNNNVISVLIGAGTNIYRTTGGNSQSGPGYGHSHTISNVGTSGGYGADKPSWAGANYCITTGQ
jgi:microcystin-dependent protein